MKTFLAALLAASNFAYADSHMKYASCNLGDSSDQLSAGTLYFKDVSNARKDKTKVCGSLTLDAASLVDGGRLAVTSSSDAGADCSAPGTEKYELKRSIEFDENDEAVIGGNGHFSLDDLLHGDMNCNITLYDEMDVPYACCMLQTMTQEEYEAAVQSESEDEALPGDDDDAASAASASESDSESDSDDDQESDSDDDSQDSSTDEDADAMRRLDSDGDDASAASEDDDVASASSEDSASESASDEESASSASDSEESQASNPEDDGAASSASASEDEDSQSSAESVASASEDDNAGNV